MTFRTVIAVLSILCVAVVTHAQGVDEKLRSELLAMRDRDQRARDSCNTGTTDERWKCYANMAETIDKPNTKRLKEIFKSIGFPEAKAVGKDGVEAFLLILQHSNDLEL